MECGVGGIGALSMEVGIPGGAGDGGAGETGHVAYTWPPPAPPIKYNRHGNSYIFCLINFRLSLELSLKSQGDKT